MDDSKSPFLSPTAPQLFPKQAHTRSTSRSPTRLLSPNDDFLSDLSPARAYDLFTNPSGRLQPALEAASQPDRAFGTRAALASKSIHEWVDELEAWTWPAEGGSLGFEVPDAKRRKLSTGSEYTQENTTGVLEPQYIGSLPAHTVAAYETRIDQIHSEMDELNVEEIKRQVLDTHFSPRSRPSSSASNAPTTLTSSYNRMDDFTAIVTAVVLKALPNLSKLMRLMDVWNIRLTVLRRVPRLLRHMKDAETGLKSGWNAIRVSENGNAEKNNEALSRADFVIMQKVLQAKVTELGQDLDSMLDTLEGRQDTLPDAWLDRMESIEHDYGEWTIAGDRKVREGEWEKAARLKREQEERIEAELRRKKEEKRKKEEEEKRIQEEKRMQEEEKKRQEEHAAKIQAEMEAEKHRKRQLEEAAALQTLQKREREAAEIAARELKANEEELKAKKEAHEAEIESLRPKEEKEAQQLNQVWTVEPENEPAIASIKAVEQPSLEAEYAIPTTQAGPLKIENFGKADQKDAVDLVISSPEAQNNAETHLGAEKIALEAISSKQQDDLDLRHRQGAFHEEDNSLPLASTSPVGNYSKESPKSQIRKALPAGLSAQYVQTVEVAQSANAQAGAVIRASDGGISTADQGILESVDEIQTDGSVQDKSLDQNQVIAEEGAVGSENLKNTKDSRALKPVDISSTENIQHQLIPSGTNHKLPFDTFRESSTPITRSGDSLSTISKTDLDLNQNSEEQSPLFQAASPPFDVVPAGDAESISLSAATPCSTEQIDSALLYDLETKDSDNSPNLDSSVDCIVIAVMENTTAGPPPPDTQDSVDEKQRPISALQKFEDSSDISPQLAPQANLTKAHEIPNLDGPADHRPGNCEAEATHEALMEPEDLVVSQSILNTPYPEVQNIPLSRDLLSREEGAKFVPAPKDVLQQSTNDATSHTSPLEGLGEQVSIQRDASRNRPGLFHSNEDRATQVMDDKAIFKPAHQEQAVSASYFSSSSDTESSSEAVESEAADYFRSVELPTPISFPHDSQTILRSPVATPVPSTNEFGHLKLSDLNISPKSVRTRADDVETMTPGPMLSTDINDLKIPEGITEDPSKDRKPGVLHTPVLARKTSVTRINSGARQILISRKDGALYNDSATSNGNSPTASRSPIRPSTPPLRRGSIGSLREIDDLSPSIRRHRHVYSSSDSPPSIPDISILPNRARNLSNSSTNTMDNFATDLPLFKNVGVSATPPASPKKNNSEDQMQQQISSLLETIPARIRLTSEPNFNPPEKLVVKKTRPSGASTLRSSSSMSTYSRAPTPSFTLAPAHTKGPSRQRPQNGNPEIKLYHLSRSTGEAPIKLFVRLVGENGERVMVRVGGGWADLGEYLREYASHHGRRSAAVDDNKVEIQDLPSRVVSSSSTTSTATLRGNERPSPASRPGSAFDRPMSSLNIRKTRKSTGAGDLEPPPHASNFRSPSTPLPSSSIRAYQYDTPPSVASSSASNSTSASGNPGYDRSSSRMSWTEEDSSLGLAGPKSKRVVISERDQEWVDSMKEKVRTASAEKEKPKHPGTRKSFGEMEKVGGTKRLFRKS